MISAVTLSGCISCLGILFSGLIISPIIIIHVTNRDHRLMLPFLTILQRNAVTQYQRHRITESSLERLEYYISVIGDHAVVVSLVLLIWNSINIIMDLLLLSGACCRVRFLFIPWLVHSFLQILVIGCPIVIFSAYLGLHFILQNQYLMSLLSMFIPTTTVLFLFIIWSTVLSGFVQLGKTRIVKYRRNVNDEKEEFESLQQPILSNVHGYRHSQYTRFYQPRNTDTRTMGPPHVTLYPALPQWNIYDWKLNSTKLLLNHLLDISLIYYYLK